MPGIIQRSLAGGEISGALLARGDTAKYATGWYRGSDWFVDRNGTALNRAGTQYVLPTKDSHDDVRNISWVFNDEQSYDLEFGEGYVRFFQDGGYLLTGAQPDWADATEYAPGAIRVGTVGATTGKFYYCVATHTSSDGDNGPHDTNGPLYFWYELTDSDSSAILELPTPYLRAELAEIRVEQSADVMTITHRSHTIHELTRLGATQWTLLPTRFGSIQSAPSDIAIGVATGTGSADFIRYAVTAIRPSTFEESRAAAAATVTNGVAVTGGSVSDVVLSTGAHGLSTGDEVVIAGYTTVSGDDESHENARIALVDSQFYVTVIDAGSFSLDGTAGIFEAPVLGNTPSGLLLNWAPAYISTTKDTPSLVGAGDDIDIVWAQVEGAERYYIYRSVNRGPFGFMAEVTDATWTDDGSVTPDEGFTAPQFRNPFEAGEYPAVSTYHQQRHLFAGSINSPQKVRASVVGDYRNFSTRSTTTDDDAVEFTIAGGEANEIVGLDVLGQLIIRTTGSVWTARGNSDGRLTPTAINLERLANEGSSRLEALIVGDSLLYPQARGSIIRELRYDLNTGGYGGYAGSDITIYASHLFQGRTIKSWGYAPSPFALVWVVLDDGSCVALTHVNEQEIRAWHRHDFGGDVLSVAIVPENGIDTPYFIVKRTIDGSVVRYHERLRSRLAGATDYNVLCDSHFLDSSLSYDGRNTGATTITVMQDLPITEPPTGLGLDASTGIFTAGSVGEEFTVTLGDGVAYRFLVTGYNGPTNVNVMAVGAAPSNALLSAATTTWTRMVSEFSGLEHLEGESVGVMGDGTDGGTYTVTAGAITTAANYGCVDVGLRIDNFVDSLDLDYVGAVDAVGNKLKSVSQLTAYCYATLGLTAGNPGSRLELLREDDRDAPRDPTSTALLEGKLRAKFDARFNRHGRVRFVQPKPLPACIAGFIPVFKITEDT